ncbi:MAG: hypothetical protein ACRENE_09165 [Polyangiaceae bacterium]
MHPVVEEALASRFAGEDVVAARTFLAKISLLRGAESPASAARLQMAAIRLAGPSLEGLNKAVELAGRDWRDLLMASGLAHADWRDVLARDGFGVP